MLATPSPIPYHAAGKDDGFGLTVMSGDGASFSVDRTKLSAASGMFRSLGPVLRLSEPASSVRRFLDVLDGVDVFPVVNNRAPILGVLDVMVLLHKYDCTAALTLATTSLKCLVMEKDVCPLEAFVLGAAIGDVALCRAAIVAAEDDVAASQDVQEHWKSVPANFRRALAKACEVKDPRDRGNRFVEAMYLDDNRVTSYVEYSSTYKAPTESKTKTPTTTIHVRPVAVAVPAIRIASSDLDEDPFLSDDE